MNFFDIISHNTVDQRIDRLARKLVKSGIEPGIFIQSYLDNRMHEHVLTEGWMGNFFTRIGNAWRAFWKPIKEDDPNERLNTAKEALTALMGMVKDNAGGNRNLDVVLNGLEQSLNIISKVDPYVKKFNQDMMQNKGNRSFASTAQSIQLPPDQQSKYMQIMQAFDQIERSPDSHQKLQQLMANDDQLNAFIKELESIYQNPQMTDAEYKRKLGEFLKMVETDAAFREIKSLLDFARQRSDSDTQLLRKRPDNWKQVRTIYRTILPQVKNDAEQAKNAMLNWYATRLPADDPIKKFVHDEMRIRPGSSEQDLFWAYASEWIRSDPWHMQANQPQRA